MDKRTARSRQMVHAVGHWLVHIALTALQIRLWGQLCADGAHWPQAVAFGAGLLLLSFSYLGIGLMMHEGAHGHLSPSRFGNEVLFHLCAVAIQTVPSLYRTLHWLHHISPNEEDDWELIPEAGGGLRGARWRRALWALVLFGGLERNRLQEKLLWDPRAPFTDAVRRRAKLELLALKIILLLGSAVWIYALGFTSWLLGFAVPAIVGGWLLIWLQLIEHFGMARGSTPEATRDVEPRNALQRVVYWALFNINYHRLHHENASIPGLILPKANAEWVRQRPSTARPLSAPFPSYLAALRHTLPALWAELHPLERERAA